MWPARHLLQVQDAVDGTFQVLCETIVLCLWLEKLTCSMSGHSDLHCLAGGIVGASQPASPPGLGGWVGCALN